MKIQAGTQPIKTLCNFNLLVYSEHMHVNCWRLVCIYNAETSQIENYWNFGSGLAEMKVLILKWRITARAIIDDKSSCGVVPASKRKGVLCVVETNTAHEVSPILFSWSISAFERQLKDKRKYNHHTYTLQTTNKGWWQL